MTEAFSRTIQRLVSHHQRRVIARSALIIGIGVLAVAVLLWRGHQAGVSMGRLIGLGGGGVALLAVWQWLSVRRSWRSSTTTLAQLDRELKLEARLMTAAQFAAVSPQPALYPELARETARALERAAPRLPSVWSRASSALTVLALLLWLWSWPHPLPQQVARHTQQHQGAQGEQGRQGTKGSQGAQGSQGDQGKQGAQGKQGDQENSGSGDQGKQQSQNTQGEQGRQGTKGSQGAQGTQGQQGKQPSQESQRSHGQQGQQREEQARSAQGSSDQERGASTSAQGSGQAEAVKADIERALKELSGELKHLQAQLEAQQVSAAPPGTSTDPELYGEASLETPPGATSRLPLVFDVDTQTIRSPRSGGGVSQPSGEISSQTPQMEREEVQLAPNAAPESGTTAQPIPPEYQPVFEHLNNRDEREDEGG